MENLRENVKRMMAAGVPEDEIGAYIQKYSQPQAEQKTQNSEQEPQPDYWRSAFEATGGFLGGLAGGGGALIAGQLGPQVATPEEIYTVPTAATMGGAFGATLGGQIYDYGKALLTGSPVDPMEQDRRLHNDMMFGMGTPLVAAKGIELAGKAGKAMLSPVKTSLKNAVGPVGAESVEQLSRLEALGFKPEVGMLNNPEAQQLSQSLRQLPASGRVMAQLDQHNLERGAQLADEVARSMGTPLPKTEIGAAARDSVSNKVDSFFKGADVLYKRVGQHIPDRVPAENVTRLVVDTMTEMESSAVSKTLMGDIDKHLQAAASDIAADGTMSKATLQQIKRISKNAYKKAPDMVTDSDRFIMSLERAADADLNQAAINFGGADGAKAVERAKTWWKIGMSDKKVGKVGLLEDAEQIMKQSEDGKIYSWITGESKEGTARLRRVLTAVDNETSADIRATAFAEMGRPTAGNAGVGGDGFSFSTFLTSYNKMSPEARQTLFGKASGEMQGLLDASEFMRALQKRANTSGTAASNIWNHLTEPVVNGLTHSGIVGGMVGGIKGATLGVAGRVGQLVVNNRTAKLITDPDFVKWLATTGKHVAVNPQSAGPQIARLIQIAATAPEEMQPAYKEYLNSIGVPNTGGNK